ncbi:MAG: 30S ribosomal protein S16 [Parcubacteria group bacterium]|nr:30S ribosomal protein S16 [Parcubacteria group bacterium]
MLKIRLQRVGRKHEPAFRVVLTDKRNSTKSGRLLEVLGNHDPRGEREGALDKERILHFISKGAQPTATVHNLLVKKGVIVGEKIDVSAKKKKKKGEEATETGAPRVRSAQAPPVSAEKKEEAPKSKEGVAEMKEPEAKAEAPKVEAEIPKTEAEAPKAAETIENK